MIKEATRKYIILVLLAYNHHLLITSSTYAFTVRTYNKNHWIHAKAESSNNEYEKKSIGEVVNYLHGGKYQFQDSFMAGSTRVGQEFAHSLYSSDIEAEDDKDIANWALRLMDPLVHIDERITDSFVFYKNCFEERTITIKNYERSWERFHVFVFSWNQGDERLNKDDNMNTLMTCPSTGVLAPRGGASNACDENAPYSDSAEINIKWIGGRNSCDEYLLVVGTETEVKRYLLKEVA